jgi:uncharacterized protein
MFREMRRKKQLLSNEESIKILNSCTAGVLGVSGDDGYPYTVPVSYAYEDGKLYFHCAKQGHKIDGIKRNDKVSLCVIDQDKIVPQELTTYFRSVIIFGRARILIEDSEIRHALESLGKKYSPGLDEQARQSIEEALDKVCVVEIKIEHITGKAAVEVINQGK